MGQILAFFIVASLVLAVLYLVYKLMLSMENQPSLNRCVLLGIYFISFAAALPLFYKSGSGVTAGTAAGDVDFLDFIFTRMEAEQLNAASDAPGAARWPAIVICIWLTGVAVMAIKFAIEFIMLYRFKRSCREIITEDGRTIMLSSKNIAPFSFGNIIFMNESDYHADNEMIMTHEQSHLKLRHSVDIIFGSMVAILEWFNPAAWLMIDELKSVHEYQADSAVLSTGINARNYQLLLIKKAVGGSFPAIANSLNHSKLKKRITMMQKSRTKGLRRLRVLAMLPAVILAALLAAIPAFASAMKTLGSSTLEASVSENKVNEKNAGGQETIVISRDSDPEAQGDEPVKGGKKLMTAINKETGETLYEVYEVYIDGEKAEKDMLSTMPSSNIASITVDKSKGNVTMISVVTKSAGASKARVAQFPGGESAMRQWLIENITIPEEVKIDEVKRCVVKFTVSATGKVEHPEVTKSTGVESLDNEALRVVRMMPDFEPAINEEGQAAESRYALPVNFQQK